MYVLEHKFVMPVKNKEQSGCLKEIKKKKQYLLRETIESHLFGYVTTVFQVKYTFRLRKNL